MAGNWRRCLAGCLKIRMTGCTPERFFNICCGQRIEIWDISCCQDGYEFYMTIQGFRNSKALRRKSGVRLRIIKKLGLPFFLYRNRKRKLFFAGFSLFFLLLYTLSLFIWDIEIDGNCRYSQDTLMDFFTSQKICCGMPAKSVACEDLEEALRMNFSEITWVSAQVSGTRLLVKLKENQVFSSIPEKNKVPCDLVAEKSGTIISMIVRQGTPAVQIGETVEAGQLLVSGTVSITDDSDTVIAVHPVQADATVRARTSSSMEQSFPLWRTVESYTGKQKNGLFFRIFSYSASLFLPELDPSLIFEKKPEKQPWKFTMEETQGKLSKNFYLPVYWGTILGKEYGIYQRPYREEEKEELKNIVNSQFLEKLMEKGVQIMGNNVRIQESGGQFTILCTAETEEPIGISRPLSITDQSEETDKQK